MDPQHPPAPPAPAHHPVHLDHHPVDIGHEYSEKDAYDPRPRAERGSKGSSKSRAHDSVISYPRSPNLQTPSPPSPASSLSSVPRHHPRLQDPVRPAPIDPAAALPARALRDPEKADGSQRRAPSNPDVTRQTIAYDVDDDYDGKGPEDKPVQLLVRSHPRGPCLTSHALRIEHHTDTLQLYLSLPCALLSFLIMLWTMVALLISLFLQPFRLFSSRSPAPSQLTTFLAPPLNLQLHLVYSFSASTEYSAPMLVVVHLFSPFVAVGVAIAAWTAAFFWFFSAILGDPAGQDGHNDGKESILSVRNWWDRWLSRALR